MSERYKKCLTCNIGCPLSGEKGLLYRYTMTGDEHIIATFQENPLLLRHTTTIFVVNLQGVAMIVPVLKS